MSLVRVVGGLFLLLALCSCAAAKPPVKVEAKPKILELPHNVVLGGGPAAPAFSGSFVVESPDGQWEWLRVDPSGEVSAFGKLAATDRGLYLALSAWLGTNYSPLPLAGKDVVLRGWKDPTGRADGDVLFLFPGGGEAMKILPSGEIDCRGRATRSGQAVYETLVAWLASVSAYKVR